MSSEDSVSLTEKVNHAFLNKMMQVKSVLWYEHVLYFLYLFLTYITNWNGWPKPNAIFDLLIRSESLWRWYIDTITEFLDIIHRPVPKIPQVHNLGMYLYNDTSLCSVMSFQSICNALYLKSRNTSAAKEQFLRTMLTSHATTVLREENMHSVASARVGNNISERI